MIPVLWLPLVCLLDLNLDLNPNFHEQTTCCPIIRQSLIHAFNFLPTQHLDYTVSTSSSYLGYPLSGGRSGKGLSSNSTYGGGGC